MGVGGDGRIGKGGCGDRIKITNKKGIKSNIYTGPLTRTADWLTRMASNETKEGTGGEETRTTESGNVVTV
jgi:hypothetical protein